MTRPSAGILCTTALFPPSLHSSSPQDFVLLKERTLDEAPRPPKKAMDYSSSSEEVESSDDDEESNGEPSEGSRDAPGARYGVPWGGGASRWRQSGEGCRWGRKASGASLRERFPFSVGNPGCHCWSVLPPFP